MGVFIVKLRNAVVYVKTCSPKIRATALSVGAVVGTFACSTMAWADGATLDPNISAGFTTAGENVALIIGAGVLASVGVIALSAGAKAGLKWIKGVFAKA
jgi:hypothetical protein